MNYFVVFIKFINVFLFSDLLRRNRECMNLVLLRFILWFRDFNLLLFVNFWFLIKLRSLFILFSWWLLRVFIVVFIWFIVSVEELGRFDLKNVFILVFFFVMVFIVFVFLWFVLFNFDCCFVVIFVILFGWEFRWYFSVNGKRFLIMIFLNFVLGL